MRARRPLAWLLVFCASCADAPARAPAHDLGLPAAFATAFRADAVGEPHDAIAAYLEVVRAAASADRDPWQLAALQASLDALATRTMPSLGNLAEDAALSQRSREAGDIVRELSRHSQSAKGPFARGLIARALRELAQRRGDTVDAQTQRTATGCASEALVVGPLSWTPITGVGEPDPLDRPEAKIETAYPTDDAFDSRVHPTLVRGGGCHLDLSAESSSAGVRDVIVDLDVPEAETIGLVLRAHGTAELRIGGVPVVKRPFELGDREAARFVRLHVDAGELRLVARVGTAKDDDWVEIDAFGADGMPLRAHAPAVGSSSRRHALRLEATPAPTATTDDESLLAGAGAMAAGDPRTAEWGLWSVAAHPNAPPELALVYGRALETSRDLSPAIRAERARGAYERVVEARPGQWESTIASAVLAGIRRGRDEAWLEALRDLDAARSKRPASSSLIDAFEGMASGRERLFDRAAAALGRARLSLASTTLLTDAEDVVLPRVGPARVTAQCDLARPIAHDTLDCLDALRDAGDRAGMARELARLRSLLGAPSRFLSLDLREALVEGERPAALRALAAMLPAERTLSALALLSAPSTAAETRALLLQMAPAAPDAPGAIAPLLEALGDDSSPFDARADRLVAEDRAHAILPSAATAVLAHEERYDVSSQGLVHWTLFDVRRVSGTTDVEESPSAPFPEVWGRGATRTLRRRILKKDGRVVEPERAPRASQEHADLSQLEQGDAVEAVYEGYSLPGDTGDVGIDSPDLLPYRSAVKDATIEIRMPHWLKTSLWSHPLLGKPAERDEDGVRVLTWHVADAPERLIEDRVPRMDRSVRVSVSTMVWSRVGRALRETLAALDEHDPEIADWAHRVVGDGAQRTSLRDVEAVVAAAGKALREGDSDLLSDYGGGVSSVQDRSARASLASHQGSRSWLIVRALRELGISSDVVVAEEDPYSADPAFPPHFARFVHPLVVAHLTDVGPAAHDVWIDADIQGPPLPAGRVSPELRGRLALYPDGTLAPLPPTVGTDQDRDEVDVRLTLDGAGNARGTFAVVLQGRGAQELAEALYRTVGADRQRALRDVVLAWLPWANVDDVTLSSAEGSWQVSLRADVSVSGYAQTQGDKTWLLPGIDTLHWVWPKARVSSLGATFAARADRESALAVSTAIQYHLHRKVELPAGAAIARLPGPVEVSADLLRASRKVAIIAREIAPKALPDDKANVDAKANVIDEDFSLGLATGTIAKSGYARFVTAAHAVDDGFLASARVSKEVSKVAQEAPARSSVKPSGGPP
jgi:hypothetical protein